MRFIFMKQIFTRTYILNSLQSTTKITDSPQDEDRHVGDFGNVTADKHGNVQNHLTHDLVKLRKRLR